jgi:hypothetical protein
VGLILKGLEYIEENRITVSIGERKTEPAIQHRPSPQPAPQPVHEPAPEMVQDESQDTGEYRGPGGRITDRIRKFWEGIIDATDEKMDDNTLNN